MEQVSKVLIRRLRLPVKIGCEPSEREFPQVIEFDIDIVLKHSRASTSGFLGDTVCYKQTVDVLAELVRRENFPLLEQLAAGAAQQIFETFPAADSVRLLLRKFVVPHAEWVGYETIQFRNS